MIRLKKAIITLSLSLITFQLLSSSAYAKCFEEFKQLSTLESNETNDVDSKAILKNLKVSARNAIAIDSKTNQVLFEQNADEIVPMASTTKILTALVAITQGDLNKEVTISKKAAAIRGSKVGYSAGEKIKLKELLYGLMYKSGNDAAIAIAEDIGGSIEGFAKIMNDYAMSLGLINSHFESPHGLDSAKHYTSAYDLAILTAKAMENELFCEICGTKSITKDVSNFTRDYSNINKILYKIPQANGVKTGYTGQAGKCLVSSVKHEGRNIIIVVLNCSDRWNVTEKIFNYVSEKYKFKSDNIKNITETSEYSNLGSVIQECDFDYGFSGEGNIEIEVFNTINKNEGDIVGKVYLNNNGEEIVKKELIFGKDISEEEFDEIINKGSANY